MKKYMLYLENDRTNKLTIYVGIYKDETNAYNALIRRARRHGHMQKGDVFRATIYDRGYDYFNTHYGKPVKVVHKIY